MMTTIHQSLAIAQMHRPTPLPWPLRILLRALDALADVKEAVRARIKDGAQ